MSSATAEPPRPESAPASAPAVVKRRKRVQIACDRCRRQKLKCGNERPCPLCVLSEVPCIPQNRPARPKQPKKKRMRIKEPAFVEGSSPLQRSPHSDGLPNGEYAMIETPQSRGLNHASSATVQSPSIQDTQDGASMDAIEHDGSTPFRQRTSSVGMFREILSQFSPDMVLNGSTSALPGGNKTRAASPVPSSHGSRLEDFLDMKLPCKEDMDFLLQSYLNSVHWFMMVFHEPSFRARYESLFTLSSPLDQSQRCFTIFLLLTLSMGARYADKDELQRRCPTLDGESFQKASLKKVEENMLELFDEGCLEGVQICVMLSSFYLYTGKPNLGFVTLGSGIRCAHSISLHRESPMSSFSRTVREERRRTWWALYIFDRFASIVYGRPCGIRDGEFNVGVPRNMGDTNAEHPYLQSDAATPGGRIERVTLFSYTKYKVRLYTIASPIIGDMYFHRASDMSALRQKVQRIDGELTRWYNALPPEMRLDKLYECPNPGSPGGREATDIFALQALALQVAYDNILILLHRPLLPYSLDEPSSMPGDENGASPTEAQTQQQRQQHQRLQQQQQQSHQLDKTSPDRCWESAMRTSILGRYHTCLEAASQTHAAAFLGINLFTAGMVLCIVALSKPLSAQAQYAKHAVARVLTLSRFLESRAAVTSQISKVLVDLVRLILDREMKAILGQHQRPEGSLGMMMMGSGNLSLPPAWNSRGMMQGEQLGSSSNENGLVGWDVSTACPPTPQSSLEMSQVANKGGSAGAYSNDNDASYPSMLSSLDLQEGLQSLQQAMYTSNDPMSDSMADGNTVPDTWGFEGSRGMASPDISRFVNGASNLDSLGQSWLWEPQQWSGLDQSMSLGCETVP